MAKSADEVRAERLSVLGPEFGQVYHALCNEVQWCVWQLYLAHFGSLIWPTPLVWA
jgi:hypothetical protein